MNMLKNGTATVPTKETSVINNALAAVPLKPVAAPEKPKEQKEEQPNLEDRILRIQILSDLIAKREKLQDSLKKISSYKFSSESRFDKLTIEDGEGNEFTTTNTDVLKEVVATIKATILRKIGEVDSSITF